MRKEGRALEVRTRRVRCQLGLAPANSCIPYDTVGHLACAKLMIILGNVDHYMLRSLGRDRYYAYHGTNRHAHYTYTSEYREQGIFTILIIASI